MFGKLPPIVSGALPPPQQASAPSLGHAFLRCPPISNFSLPSPVYKSTSRPAFEIKEIGYSIFYPCDEERKKGSKKWVSWVPEPEKGILDGYEKFIGKSGLSWMCEFFPIGIPQVSRHFADPIVKVLGAAVGRISVSYSDTSPDERTHRTELVVPSSSPGPTCTKIRQIPSRHLLTRSRWYTQHLLSILRFSSSSGQRRPSH